MAKISFKFPTKLPINIPPLKACSDCKMAILGQASKVKSIIAEIKKHGITQAAVQEFVQDVVATHDEITIQVLAAFVGASAQGILKGGSDAAAKRFITGYLQSELQIAKHILKTMIDVSPQLCQWHQPTSDLETGEETYGPVPPATSDDSHMYG